MSSDTVGTSTGPVRAAHGFDSAALTAYLEKHVDGFRGPIQVRQFSFGQSNPSTFLIAWRRHPTIRCPSDVIVH